MAQSAAQRDVDDWITPSADGADDWVTGEAPKVPSGGAAFVHAAERGALPAAGGWAGMAAGAKLGAVAGALIPGLGETGIGEVGGAIVGGIAGGMGGAAAVEKVQQKLLDLIPEDVKAKIGQSKSQQEAEQLAHPYISMAGEIAPNLALLRPGAVATTAREGAGLLERTLSNPIGSRAVGAGFNAAQEAGTELATDGDLDPGKVAIAAGAGALMNRETALGTKLRTGTEALIPSRARPVVSPTDTAAPVLAAENIDQAIAAAQAEVTRPVEVEAPAEAAAPTMDRPEALLEQPGEAAAPVKAAEKPGEDWVTLHDEGGAEIGWYHPDSEEVRLSEAGATEAAPPAPAAAEQPIEAAPAAPEPQPLATEAPEQAIPQNSVREFQPYAEAKVRADNYLRWIDELDQQRRDAAAKSPQARFLQQNIDAILGKVNGVQDRLTKSGAERLAKTRQSLDDLLNPVGDSPDMARVRQSMVAEHQNMADAVVVHRDQALTKAQQARQAAQELEENIPAETADQIAGHMDQHGIDAATAVGDHIEGRALSEVISDHEQTGAYPEAEPLRGRASQPDRGTREGVEGRPALRGDEGLPGEARGADAQNPVASDQLTTFTTARGSIYEVHPDGTTTRNKAARPDPGHEGQSGPQPRSEQTFYVTKEHADQLGLFQTQGGTGKKAIARRPDGTAGVKYLDGKDAGKFERRTVAAVSDHPEPGLVPVEIWKGGQRAHFGNEITHIEGARLANERGRLGLNRTINRSAESALFKRPEEEQSLSRSTAAKEQTEPTTKVRGVFTPEFDAARQQFGGALRQRLDELGLKDIALKLPDAIIAGGEHVDGAYAKKIIAVALDSHDPAGTLDHEAIHGLRALGLFNKSEWSLLREKASREWRNRYNIDKRYADFSEDKRNEEAIAEAFRYWRKGSGDQKGTIARLFDKMRNAISAVGNALRGAGFHTTEDIFAKVESGEVGGRPRHANDGEQVLFQFRDKGPDGNEIPMRAVLIKATGKVEFRPIETKAPAVKAEAPAPAKTISSTRPIEGTGSERTRAINGELYNVGEEKPQLDAAAELVSKDPERAIAIAMRQKQAPKGVHPEFVYMALEAKAIKDGDIELQRKLSTSKIAEEATTMGQRIAAWRNRGEISPVDDMRRIQEARAAKASRNGEDLVKATDAMVAQAKAEIKKTMKPQSLNDFVLANICAS